MSDVLTTSNAVEGLVGKEVLEVVSEAEVMVNRLTHPQQKQLFCYVMAGEYQKAQTLWMESKHRLIQTKEQVEAQAVFLRNASADACWACNIENRHKTGWVVDPTGNTPSMSWEELAAVACECLSNFRSSRRVLFPNWEKRLAEIAHKVHTGEITPDRVLYTDKCSQPGCGQLFKVTARNAAVGWVTQKKFLGWTKCPSCVQKQKLQRPAYKAAQKETEQGDTMVIARKAPRLNALTKPHSQAHGWSKLGDNEAIKKAFEGLRKKGGR